MKETFEQWAARVYPNRTITRLPRPKPVYASQFAESVFNPTAGAQSSAGRMIDAGTGRTTRQMQDAPQGAVFVWPVWSSIGYARDLARHLGRRDLAIITPSRLRDIRPGQYSAVIVDHAVRFTKTELAEFQRLLHKTP